MAGLVILCSISALLWIAFYHYAGMVPVLVIAAAGVIGMLSLASAIITGHWWPWPGLEDDR